MGLGIITALFSGYVLTLLWGWFITPTFVSAPPLNKFQAIGLFIVFEFFFTGQRVNDAMRRELKDKDYSETTKHIIRNFVMIAFVLPLALFTGWVWHHFTP